MTWPVLNYPADLAIKTATKVESSLFTIKSEQDFLNIMKHGNSWFCLLYTSPSPRDRTRSRMPSSA